VNEQLELPAAASAAPMGALGSFFGVVESASTGPLPEAIDALREAGDWQSLLVLAAALDDAKERIGFACAEVALALYETMPGKIGAVEGVASAEKKSATVRKKWAHESLAARLAALIADERRFDFETGEIDETPLPPAELAARIAAELVACAGISYWRTTALRGRGLDPADYCEEERGRGTVIVRRASSSARSPLETAPSAPEGCG